MRALRLLLLLPLAGWLAGCGVGDAPPRHDPDHHADAPGVAGWRPAAASPLGGRWSPVVAWTGTEALVVGGGAGSPCPPGAADCTHGEPMAHDGAAYDPATDTWRAISDAPVAVGYWFRSAFVDGTLVLFDGARGWWAYDVEADDWSRLPAPPVPAADSGRLAARHGRVYAVTHAGRVVALDVGHRSWTLLPADDRRPALHATSVVATDIGVLTCGPDPTTPEDGDTPRFTVVDRWAGRSWSRLPMTGSVGDLCAHWTGRRLLDADPQVAPGLRGTPPFGGRLDPATGAWSRLPHPPELVHGAGTGDGWYPDAVDGPLVAAWGYVYDDAAATWTLLGRPRSEVDSQQSAVWADGRLLVFGGVDEQRGYDDPDRLSAATWVWTPGVASAP